MEDDKRGTGDELFDELATLQEIERVLRCYIVNYYKPHSEQHDRPFAPGTVRLVESVEPLLDHLDEGRKAGSKLAPAIQ
ncbi:MAG: hypothetical protein WCF57_20170 [Pyrinomonadaceae bacterium]